MTRTCLGVAPHSNEGESRRFRFFISRTLSGQILRSPDACGLRDFYACNEGIDNGLCGRSR